MTISEPGIGTTAVRSTGRVKSLLNTVARPAGRALLPAFLTSFVARFGQVAMAVLAARILGPVGFGVFTFALGVGLIGGRIAGLGLPTLMNRLVPKYTITEDWGALRGLVRTADGLTFATAAAGGLSCIGVALWLGRESDLYLGLIMGGLLLPVMAFRSLYRNTLAALRVPQRGIMVDELLPYALMTLFLAAALLFGATLEPGWAAGLFIVAGAIAVGVGRIWIRGRLPGQLAGARPAYSLRFWLSTALPALLGTSATMLMNRADTLMLAPLGTMQDVGYYGAAMRVSYMQSAPVIVLSTVITARLAEAFAAGRVAQGKRIYFGALAFAFLWSAPVAALLAIFGSEAMTLLFGEEFAPGGSVLAILAIAQIGATANIPAASLMLMTGRQNMYGIMTAVALAANVIANLILIPRLGAEGAAIASCASIFGLAGMQMAACALILRSGRFEERAR